MKTPPLPLIVAAGLVASGTSFAQEPAPAEPTPPNRDTDEVVETESTVTASQDERSYDERYQSTATRFGTPTEELPASVQVIPEDVFEDQGIWRLKDTYRNVSGVETFKTEGFAVTFESAFVRGFQQNPYINGTRTFGLGPVDLQGLESVEVLKGPGSLLFGAIEPGGVINLVPKLPSFTPRYSLSLEAGSYDHYRGGFDISTPVGTDGDEAFRINGAYQNSNSFRNHLDDESIFLAPSYTWNVSRDTQVSAWLWYQHQEKPVDDGVAFSSAGKPVASIDTFLGDPDHNTQTIDDFLVGVSLESEIDHDLRFRQELHYNLFDSEMDAVRRFGSTSGTETVQGFYDASKFDHWGLNSRTELLWSPETDNVRHEIATGLQAYYSDYEFRRRRDTASVPPIDIVNPSFPDLTYSINNTGFTKQNLTFFGLYAQDHMRMLDDRLHALVGLRADSVRQDNNPGTQDDDALTWQAGLLYEATPWFSPYASISTSFNPTSVGSETVDGSKLDPETGTQLEAGAKFSLLDDRLLLTSAVYQIVKDDVTIADPANPGFSLNGGKLESQGLELDISGRLTSNLDVVGSYAYTDTEVKKSSSLPEGERFRGIPLHSGSLWLVYDGLMANENEGLSFGGGVFASSDKAGDNNDSFELPSFVRFDLGAWYDRELGNGTHSRFSLNVLNVTDEEYYESSFNGARIQPGDPLTFVLGMTLTM